jgi:hypothetical protein
MGDGLLIKVSWRDSSKSQARSVQISASYFLTWNALAKFLWGKRAVLLLEKHLPRRIIRMRVGTKLQPEQERVSKQLAGDLLAGRHLAGNLLAGRLLS